MDIWLRCQIADCLRGGGKLDKFGDDGNLINVGGTASGVNLDVGVLEVVVILMGVCGVGGVAGVSSI